MNDPVCDICGAINCPQHIPSLPNNVISLVGRQPSQQDKWAKTKEEQKAREKELIKNSNAQVLRNYGITPKKKT